MPNWTTAQQNAIDAREHNILVSAAAGSGKTAVLVARVVKLITDEVHPVDIDKLLIVTFTNAAAAEMKNRISSALSEKLKEEPNNTNILRQISLLPNANICTIDSFCMNLVRDNFFRLNIAQDFKILDDAQKLLMEQTIIEEIVEELYEEDQEEFKNLVELLSTTKSDADLMKAVKRITNYLSSQPFPLECLKRYASFYRPDQQFDESELCRYVISEVKDNLHYIHELIAYSRLHLNDEDDMAKAYSGLLDRDEELILRISDSLSSSWDELCSCVLNTVFSKVPSSPRGYDSLMKRVVMSNRDIYKNIIKNDLPLLLCADTHDIHTDNEYLYPIFLTLIKLIERYSERLMQAKKEIESYSFSDIEHFAINLLFYQNEDGMIIKTDLAKEYEDVFDEILVDEYQDTNSAQDKLFEMLSNGHNRFMVGDVKQSIYRFRLAMPQIFTNKKDTFTPYDSDEKDINRKIILDRNFRSRRDICEFTNFIFRNLMSRKIGEVEYNEDEFLNAAADYPETGNQNIQLHLVETPEGENADEYEAHQMASYILGKVRSKEQIADQNGTRDIRFGDFAILFRSPKNRMHIFSKVFTEYGIPVVANNRVNLFENNEVSILISLLRVIDNPIQDIPLLSTLMSVFYGYTADDIAAAKVNFPSNHLYTSICRDSEHFSVFLETLSRYRQYAASMSVENFLRQILSDTSYLSLIAAMGNHEQRKLNVMKFIDFAKRFDQGENVGLTAFMRYIDSMIDSKVEIESADASHSGENCVNLMSIHKSKGLEFPVVILAAASHRYNSDDLRDTVLLSNRFGLGLKVNDENNLYRYQSVQYSCIKDINTYELMSENLRVLYVAITRAKEQFIVFASFKDIATHINNLSKKLIYDQIPANVIKKTSNDADMILMCALLHRDGDVLREMCDTSIKYHKQVRFDLSCVISNKDAVTEETQAVKEEADKSLVDAIRQKLRFTYERSELSRYVSKRTASSLDEKEQNFRYFAKTKPAFLSESKLTSAQKGTAMHSFMQHCDYDKAKENLEKEIEHLKAEAFLSETEANSLDRAKLTQFFNGTLAERMFNSKHLYREIKVSSFVDVSEFEDTNFDDKVLVQGIADCVFEEDGKLVLVDYKTDYVTSEEELLGMYKNQIAFYRSAVSKTLGKEVKEAMLYSFCLSKPCIYK